MRKFGWPVNFFQHFSTLGKKANADKNSKPITISREVPRSFGVFPQLIVSEAAIQRAWADFDSVGRAYCVV